MSSAQCIITESITFLINLMLLLKVKLVLTSLIDELDYLNLSISALLLQYSLLGQSNPILVGNSLSIRRLLRFKDLLLNRSCFLLISVNKRPLLTDSSSG
ncbi:MAG: hypothetical protein EZS28_013970 [Streblomastix strix]|uniref:Uncharacterized protein n=1 Tax=Streblomastix strix TaxID=222440 RepID=A0A5J4W6C8_9EUKA|nr:MAG: hypothetical protein EZS28_013970 [Streblomastix strix]